MLLQAANTATVGTPHDKLFCRWQDVGIRNMNVPIMPHKKKVLILSARAPAALEWARHYHAADWQVFMADYAGAGQLSAKAHLAESIFQIPAPAHDAVAFILALKNLIIRHGIDCIVPTCEEIFYLAQHQKALSSLCQIFCSDIHTLNRLHNKWLFANYAQSLGIPTPQTELINSHESSDCETVCKPLYSRFGSVIQFYPAHAPLQASLPLDGSWLKQTRIHGQEVCSYSIAIQGQLIAHVCYRGLYRYRQGASFYFKRCDHPSIRRHVETMVQDLQFTGQIAFDWMIDSTEQTSYVLECNPRATSGIHLFKADGSLIAAMDTGQEVTAAKQDTMLLPMMLSSGFLQALKHRQLTQWYRDMRQAKDVLGSWSVHLGAIQDALHFLRIAQKHQLSLEAATVHDMAWNGETMKAMIPLSPDVRNDCAEHQ